MQSANMSSSPCILDEFENSFQSCLSALTNANTTHIHDSEEVKTSVEQTIQRFLDAARQIECFFLQKRLLLAAQKPELIIAEDCTELRNEIARKDQILQKYYEKLQMWQNILNETMGSAPANIQRQGSLVGAQGGPQTPQAASTPVVPLATASPTGQPNIHQQMRHQAPVSTSMSTSSQPHMMQGAVPPQIPSGPSSHQPLTPPQVGPGMIPMQPAQLQGGMHPPPPPQTSLQQAQAGPMMTQMGPQSMQPFIPQQSHGGGLQGPLAFLERTTSNIGLPDPRR